MSCAPAHADITHSLVQGLRQSCTGCMAVVSRLTLYLVATAKGGTPVALQGAVGIQGGQWSANWQITRSTKSVHLLKRLIHIGAARPPAQHSSSQVSKATYLKHALPLYGTSYSATTSWQAILLQHTSCALRA